MAAYDLAVVGGGTAGLVAAAGSAGLGARVVLIERDRLGGECLWTGCVPSKALIASARAAHASTTDEPLGLPHSEAQPDFGRVMEWVRRAQACIEPHDSADRFRSLGVEVMQGNARFTGERTLSVDGRTIFGKRILIATGSAPAIPPVEGVNDVDYLTNESIFSLERQPQTLIIVGGGPVGLELAQAFCRLGTTVHVVEAESRLLGHEDAELAALLGRQLESEGVHVHVGARIVRIRRGANGHGAHLELAGEDGGGSTFVDGDALLIATGRRPRVEDLDLANAGVEVAKGGIVVDESLRTTAHDVWAAGDCVGPLRFTHVADYQARVIVRNAFFPFHMKADYSAVPWVTFTDPELAHVGLTEDEARARHGDAVRVWRKPFSDVDRAVVDGRTTGMVKLITTRRGRIVGGHILGHGAGNMIGEITLAMKHGISATSLGNTIHPYPTYPDAIRQAAESYTRSRFTGAVKRAVNWYVRR